MGTIAEHLPRRHKLTVTDYYHLADAGSLTDTDRVELIDGEIIDMSPIGSRHAGLVDRLNRGLHARIEDKAMVRVQGPVRLDEWSEPEPDIALLRPKDDFYMSGHPGAADVLLVIEVADASLAYDRDIKIPLYARHHIPEAWLVNIENQRLTVHRQPSPDGYREVIEPTPLAEISVSGVVDLAVDLSGLFSGLPR